VLASRVAVVRRLFTPRRQMIDEVTSRAGAAFFDNRIHHTAGGSGVCVYVSLFERTAVVLADETALAAIGQPGLDELAAQLVAAIRAGDLAGGLCAAIGAVGDRLADALPRGDDDVDELPDALVTID